jgi:hypothetical protein
MESAGIGGNRQNLQKFYCEICDHYASQSSDFARHCQTRKHQNGIGRNRQESAGIGETVVYHHNCEVCNRSFITQSGLWKHKKKCNKPVDQSAMVEMQKQMLDFLEKKDHDNQAQMYNFLEKKDTEFKAFVIELYKNSQILNQTQTNICQNNHNINSNNNNNTTFNLQLFLNETCKDAINLSDFIKTVKSSFEDIESIGSLGYVDGTSNVIIKHLNNLAVEKRPIHCTDAKRQTLYIKDDDQWTKEEPDLKRLQMLVDEVQRINLRVLPLWREKHPACLTSSSIHTSTYNNMSQELMGGDCSNVRIQAKDHKIINKIIKEVVIDKQMFLDNK